MVIYVLDELSVIRNTVITFHASHKLPVRRHRVWWISEEQGAGQILDRDEARTFRLVWGMHYKTFWSLNCSEPLSSKQLAQGEFERLRFVSFYLVKTSRASLSLKMFGAPEQYHLGKWRRQLNKQWRKNLMYMKSKARALSLVPHFSLFQPRLTFLELGEFHAHSRLARSTIPEGKWVAMAWSSQLRNLDEWDWAPIFLQNKYGGECRHGRPMSFCSVLSFPVSKHQEKVFMNFFNGIFGHQVAWCLNSLWVTSLIVIQHLGKFSYF